VTSNKHEDPRVQEALDADLAPEGGKWKPERAEPTAPSILARLRTMPASCISRSTFFGV